jgi:putative membrane protein
MHLSLVGAALFLWSGLLDHGARPARALAAGLISTIQMSLLGCLITLAPQPLYAPHLATAGLWGLTPLQDQQLGGALMWVPGGLAFLGAALAELKAALAPRPALAA